MVKEQKRDYRYLDSEDDRRALVEDIRRVRHEVLRIAESVPKEQWYEPRYHGWSLAAMLGHLQMMDNLCRILMQMGMIGITLPVSERMLNRFNDFMSKVFKNRVVETSLQGLTAGEKRVSDFVMRIPMERFSRLVYHPTLQTFLTVEQAVQEFYLFHWQGHLDTMRQVDDVRYEPPASSVV